MGVVVRKYIDILIIIITFPNSTCISSFFGSNIPISLFIFKIFFVAMISSQMYYGTLGMKTTVVNYSRKLLIRY